MFEREWASFEEDCQGTRFRASGAEFLHDPMPQRVVQGLTQFQTPEVAFISSASLVVCGNQAS